MTLTPRLMLIVSLALAATAVANAQTAVDFEDQQVPSGWGQPSGTNATWQVTDSHAVSGSWSLRSAAIGHSQSAAVEWTDNFEDGVLSFMLRLESESGFDYFRLFIDGEMVYSASGHRTWAEVRRPIAAGTRTIRFQYTKDSVVSYGADAAWIDDVRIGPALPVAMPLMQAPGGLIVSGNGSLAEFRHGVAEPVQHETEFEGGVAIAPDQTLYLFVPTSGEVQRYTPETNLFERLAQGVHTTAAVVAGSDRLIAGRANTCGSHLVVFTGSGNVVDGATPSPCEQSWASASIDGSTLVVVQGNAINRRSLTAPGSIVSSVSPGFTPYSAAVAADGTIWALSSQGLHHLASDGQPISLYSLNRSVSRLALREDGLIAVAGYSTVGFVRPDHGHAEWHDANDVRSIAFMPGIEADADGDGMPQWWEVAHGLDANDPADATGDLDGDGLGNLAEYLFHSDPTRSETDGDGASDLQEHGAGTDPRDPDTDDDGLGDGVEIVDLGSNPLLRDTDDDGIEDHYEFLHGLDINVDDADADADGDGLSNIDELGNGTGPQVPDSDNDGSSDGDEVHVLGTDPLDPDSDGDGLRDGDEVGTHGTDPLAVDSDGDGLDDQLEVVTLASDPSNVDTDGDGMADGWEHPVGLDLLVDDASLDLDDDELTNLQEFLLGTDPTRADSDRDGLADSDEVTMGTDPLDVDTDGDRAADGWEFAFGYDPQQADSHLDRDGDGFDARSEYWSGTAENDRTSFARPQDWSTHQGNARHNGYQPLVYRDVGTNPVLHVPLDSRVQTGVATADRIVYSVRTYFGDNFVVGLDARTGQQVWQHQFGSIFSVNAPAHANGVVYLQTGNHGGDTWLRAFDVLTGEAVFQSPHSAQWEQYLAPTVLDGTVYINGGSYGGAYAFDAVTGEQKWFASLPQFDEWTPAVDEDHVYAYTYGRLSVLDRGTGAELASIADPRYSWDGWTVGMAPVLGGYDNVMVCQGGHITAFDVLRQTVAWSRDGCHNYPRQPAVANGIVFVNVNGSLQAVDEFDGSLLWSKTFGTALRDNIVVTRDHVIVSDASSTYFVRLSDRAVTTTLPASGTKILGEDGRLVITGDSGISVFRLRLFDVESHIFFDSFE